MKTVQRVLCCVGFVLMGAILSLPTQVPAALGREPQCSEIPQKVQPDLCQERFEVQVLVNGQPLEQYFFQNRTYVEAQRGVEYEIRIRNPLAVSVAVALSVDGLNSIDARRTTAWSASKWVIRPYETLTVGGWQMSSERARRFYFTTENESYAAKLGQTTNLGLISAVFFRERPGRPIPILPRPLPRSEDRSRAETETPAPSGERSAKGEQNTTSRVLDDEYAATGIGRSVHNDVRWIHMDLDSKPIGGVDIRYEYYSALVRLGVRPRPSRRVEALPRRERSSGFEDRRFSPEP